MKIDLHTHSICSDGTDSPEKVLCKAHCAGVNVLALTDHDTVEGLPAAAAAAEKFGIEFVPGVEISAGGSDDEVHILGYGRGVTDDKLLQFYAQMRRERSDRMHEMLRRINNLGLDISPEELDNTADQPIGRMHLAQIMIKKGYVADAAQAFQLYLLPGKPGYVPRPKKCVADVVKLLASAGAVAVLAHPGQMRKPPEELQILFDAWKNAGLEGIEAWHSSHLPTTSLMFERMARKRGMLVTGGSDYHGCNKEHVSFCDGTKCWRDAQADYQALKNAIEKRQNAVNIT